MLQVFFALAMAGIGAGTAASMAPDQAKADTATAELFAMLDRRSAIDPNDPGGFIPNSCHGVVEFKDVCFSYPSRPGVPALNVRPREVALFVRVARVA